MAGEDGKVWSYLHSHTFDESDYIGFSPDPYLTGVSSEQTITGMQQADVQACVKRMSISNILHLYANRRVDYVC